MQPMGRKPVRLPGKEDCHPKRGYANWWEVEIGTTENKKGERQSARKACRDEAERFLANASPPPTA